MKISSFRLRNYRRLADVSLTVDDKKTILVGANNSGKTSFIGALHTFLMRPENLRVRDISKRCWKAISDIGVELQKNEQTNSDELEALSAQISKLLPSLDVILTAKVEEAYRARAILPHLQWLGGSLGVRIVYEPEKIERLVTDFVRARGVVSGHDDVSLWPKNLFDFLEKGRNFNKYFKQSHYILNLEVKTDDNEDVEALVQPLSTGALKQLIRVDVISEQRGLGNEDTASQKGPYSEKQRLNKLLREYYDQFLSPEDFPEMGDIEVLKKQQEMEEGFTSRLGQQFSAPLKELEDMGYPGIGGNPSVEIAAKVSGADALQKPSSVRYRFDKKHADALPENYLGLGYQNLIYLTFRLLEFRDRWMRVGKSPASDNDLTEQIEPIHLVLVEEPEVNLHAQVQRVFVAKAYETLRRHDDLGDKDEFQTQLVISTHSSHIIDDVDFKDLRYFRRISDNDKIEMDHSIIENLSELFDDNRAELRFVRKHLKLIHCDMFFADGLIFVEGQAERLLIPEFINQHFGELSSRYLSILEVSGAHTHKYKLLVEKLGIITLVITDLDSVGTDGKKCVPARGQNQTSSNTTLKTWCPKKESIDELLDLQKADRANGDEDAPLFVAYQKPTHLEGNEVLSRTFEDALILANFDNDYFQKIGAIKDATASFKNGTRPLGESLFDYVQTLTKGDFAFNCLFYLANDNSNTFNPPEYINEGLDWLRKQLSPNS